MVRKNTIELFISPRSHKSRIEELICGKPTDAHTHEDGTTHSHDSNTPGHDKLIMNETIYNVDTVVKLCSINYDDNYNTSLRIGSIFIILVVSVAGIFAPILLFHASPVTEGSGRDWVLTAGKFFGTGIIMAPAFIHILPESFIRFQSECLSDGWRSYHAYGGLFCMLASFALQLVELTAISSLDAIADRNIGVTGVHTEEKGHIGLDTKEEIRSGGCLENEERVCNASAFILELGIILHSIIIGITLGIIDSEPFNTLLVALVFHQLFEGIALGTRINDMNSQSLVKPIVMGTLFSVVTPVGIAIGMGVRRGMNPASAVLAQAILGSLSAGILLYNAYVSLTSVEINHNVGFRKSSMRRQALCFLCMYVGADIMAVLGI